MARLTGKVLLHNLLSIETVLGLYLTLCTTISLMPLRNANKTGYSGFVFVIMICLSVYRKKWLARNQDVKVEVPFVWKWFWRGVILANIIVYCLIGFPPQVGHDRSLW